MKLENKKKSKLAEVLRKMGFTITGLLPKLGISRGTFYNKAANPTVPFLLKIREATNDQLDKYYPDLARYANKGSLVEEKVGHHSFASATIKAANYYQLLHEYNDLIKRYTKLYELLIKAVSSNDMEKFKKEINQFLSKE